MARDSKNINNIIWDIKTRTAQTRALFWSSVIGAGKVSDSEQDIISKPLKVSKSVHDDIFYYKIKMS
jgi:hypothetical protein